MLALCIPYDEMPQERGNGWMVAIPCGSREGVDMLHAKALDCFTSYGFAKTTMDDLWVRAGASTGNLYHHFKSKEQLAAQPRGTPPNGACEPRPRL